MSKKPSMTLMQIINMNVGFFGIQYSFGLQQSAVNPIYDLLGASPDQIPLLNLAGPMTGLIIQPIIGAMSDKTWSPTWGRRKPYFLVGALICSVCLFLFPFSSALWMAAGLLWILDVGNNTAMEPYRAFVADSLNESQQPTGFQAQSAFTGFGQFLSYISLFIFPFLFIGKTGALPNWVYASFFLGAVLSIASIWWSMKTTPEIRPNEEEIKEINEYNQGKHHPVVQLLSVLLAVASVPFLVWNFTNSVLPEYSTVLLIPISIFWLTILYTFIKSDSSNIIIKLLASILSPFIEIIEAVKEMPKVMWQLFLVYFFQWYALMCYWQNNSKSIALSVWNVTPDNKTVYEEAVSWNGLVGAIGFVVTFSIAFYLAKLAKEIGAKKVHFVALVLTAIAFIAFPYLGNKYMFFAVIIGYGIGWASMMGIPYLLVVNQIPKSRYGVYMGIINMMIVIPMIIQNLSFGYIMRNFLGNDSRNAVLFAGIFIAIAAICVLFVNEKKLDQSIPENIT